MYPFSISTFFNTPRVQGQCRQLTELVDNLSNLLFSKIISVHLISTKVEFTFLNIILFLITVGPFALSRS